MKSSSLFIGLGIGLLVGAAMGLFIASDDEKKAKFMEDIKNKAEDAKKGISNVVKQGMEELDKAVDVINQTAQDTISKMRGKSETVTESEPESV